tara:strand:- start:9700 stop:10815 length:1116 start_codon:yes stop_codon:yes gene_type:complete
MKIGVPREIKNNEWRVGMTPSSVRELVGHGHQVMVEKGAGVAIDLHDEAYIEAGASILASAEEVFASTDMIVKVKEPQPNECKMLRENQILFTYLHLAPDPEQTRLLLEAGCSAVSYETVTCPNGSLPLLTPMSEVAGRMAVQAGAHALEMAQGGRGVLLGGVPGVPPANVVVIGGGVVGSNAIRIAIGMEARVTVIDKSIKQLTRLDDKYGAALNTVFATADAVDIYTRKADLVVGAVLVPGASAPRLISREMLGNMRRGAVLVDVAIDQGGCFETSRPTTHTDPTYVVDDIVHYCVANMPGAAARTSTFALNNATLPYIITLANKGLNQALLDDNHFMNGLNVYQGKVVHPAVASALDYPYYEPRSLLG